MSTIDTLPPPSEATRDEEAAGVEFDGVNWTEKPMSVLSSAVAATILCLLKNEVVATRAGVVMGEAGGFRCYPDKPRKFTKPDVSFVRAERLPAGWESSAMMTVPADLAVEVVSPDDVYYDVEKKVREYLDAGFGTVWVVDPSQRRVRTFGGGRRPATFEADDELTGEPFLPSFRCKVAAFFE